MNILLDLDGTLTDPQEGITRCIRHALDGLSEPCPPAADLVRYIGPPLQSTFAEMFGAGSPKIARAVSLYRERFTTEGIFENKLYPEIPGALAKLRERGAVLIVATSKMTVFAERIIDHFALRQHIHAVYGSEPDGTRANKAALIDHILKAERLAADASVMVGDREHDVIGARANGLPAVGVLWGFGTRQELVDAGAAFLCESPEELVNLLSRGLRTGPIP